MVGLTGKKKLFFPPVVHIHIQYIIYVIFSPATPCHYSPCVYSNTPDDRIIEWKNSEGGGRGNRGGGGGRSIFPHLSPVESYSWGRGGGIRKKGGRGGGGGGDDVHGMLRTLRHKKQLLYRQNGLCEASGGRRRRGQVPEIHHRDLHRLGQSLSRQGGQDEHMQQKFVFHGLTFSIFHSTIIIGAVNLGKF